MSDKKRGDLIVALFLTLFSGTCLAYVVATFPRKEKIYPGFVLLLICLLSLIQATKSGKAFKQEKTAGKGEVHSSAQVDKWGNRATMITMASTAAFLVLLNLVGFVFASLALAIGLPICLGYRNIWGMCLLAFLVVVGVHLLFAQLHVPVPEGWLWHHLFQ
jgi:hypothetical protein